MPSNFFVILIFSMSADKYASLVLCGTGLSSVIINLVPIAIPLAPQAREAANPEPSRKPPAATTGIFTFSSTELKRRVVGVEPVCPPPSDPWITNASAPSCSAFKACLRAPTVGIQITPASLNALMNSGVGDLE